MSLHRSVSQVTGYAGCGERYRLERVAKVPQRPAAWTIQGTAFHAAVEYFERHQDDPLSTYYDTYDTAIAAAKEAEPDLSRWMRGGRKKTEKDISDRREAGAEQVRGYLAYAADVPFRIWRDPDGLPGIEYEFRVRLGGVEVLGYIDQILAWPNGAVTVRDFKTGSRENNKPFQLKVYALAIEQMWETPVRYGDFWMARDSAPTKFYDLATFQSGEVERQFENMDAAEKAGFYLANPGSNCFACGVKDHCAWSRDGMIDA
ncbi:RecB family exonuclease [Yinghuangia sp. YIM S09857]|uniref:RecB family exonuclease n=1 Tax=Yinghuangia sp. YIM S09857 TaxID=3436929 RepID=UPI003F53342F